MNIGFDGKRTTHNLTGLGNYSRYIISLLAKFHPQNQYTIYATKTPSTELEIQGIEYQYANKQSVKSYWRSYGLVKNLVKRRVDLFHGLSNEIPYGLKKANIQSVVTIHDLIFLRFPEYYPFFDRFIYRFKCRYAALNADKIVAISQQTKKDLIQYFGIKDDHIQVIYQNCHPIFKQTISQKDRNTVIKKHGLPDKYILNVGTIEERKNLLLIVKALKKINTLHLVVVGKKTKYFQKIKDFISTNKLEERVHFLRDVAQTDMPALFQQAEMFIYPSRFEGFGIPIIEALHSGIPVIAARGSCLEEAGGPGSIYIDPDDENDLAAQINFIIGNPQKKTNMVIEGRHYLEKFEDKKIADQIQQLYKDVIDNVER